MRMGYGSNLGAVTLCKRKTRFRWRCGRIINFIFLSNALLFSLIKQSLPKPIRTLQFERWLDEQKVVLDGVNMVESTSATGVRGVEAVRILQKGHQVAKIPLTAMLNIEHALVDYEIGTLLKEHTWINDMFGMALLLYRFSQRQTKWGSYLEWIPQVDETRLLRQYPRNESIAIRTEWTKRRKFNEVLLGRLRAARPVFFHDLTLELLEHYVFVVQSRAFGIKVLDSAGEWHNAKCLVPFADGFNTAEQVNVACFTNAASSHFICQTTRDVAPGDELFVPYKSKSEVIFALNYGFSLTNQNGSTEGMSHSDL